MFSKSFLFELLALPLARGVTVGTSTNSLASTRNQFAQKQAVLSSPESPSIPINRTVESGCILRSYLISVPDDYEKGSSKKWPLIVDFHGRGGSPEGQWNNSQYFLNPSGKEYFVAYPLGCLGDGNDGGPSKTAWQGAPYANTSCNDILFTADLVHDVQVSYDIDNTRIYASGKSNGGGFVDTLACSTTGDLFAAFAMAAAALYTDTFIKPVNCAGERPRAILEAHGTGDKTIPINGRMDCSTPNIARWTSRWGKRNGCDSHKDRNIAFPSWGENTTYSCNGTQNFIQQYRVNDLGHCWPSVMNNTDSQEHDGACLVHTLDYTQTVVEFFAMWQKLTVMR